MSTALFIVELIDAFVSVVALIVLLVAYSSVMKIERTLSGRPVPAGPGVHRGRPRPKMQPLGGSASRES